MTAIHRLAIIDRGEPAMRCVSAVAELNRDSRERITTIALYTRPDAASWFVRAASEAMLLSPPAFVGTGSHHEDACFDPARLMAALTAARADAVWAGWEFVAEPAEFARLCERAGMTVIGPGSDAIRLLGDQACARQVAESVGVPVTPWHGEPVHDTASALPRPVAARHVQVQVVADGFGTVWAVGVRDGSLQRRNQKVIIESACTPLDQVGEQALCDAAVRLCTAAGYRGAGSVEFLVDPATRQFLFVNFMIQLQTGHAVTEVTTGLDLATLQLYIACGGRLPGSPPSARGHAIEARLSAEDPEHAFAPAPGRVSALRLPCGVGIRVDASVAEGDEITAESSPVIARIVAGGGDRREALSRLHRGLAQSIVVVDGGTTDKAFLLTLLDRPEVCAGSYDHRWLEQLTAAGEHLPPQDPVALVQAAIEAADSDQAAVQASFYAAAARGRPELPQEVGHRVELSLRGNLYRMHVYCLGRDHYRVDTGAGVIDVKVQQFGRYERAVTCFGRRYRVVADSQGPRLIVEVDGVPHVVTRDGGGYVRALAPAFVVAVLVGLGDTVRAGDPLVVVESMKMETAITAPASGTVNAVLAHVNTHVEAGAPLVQLRPADQPGSPAGRPAADPDRRTGLVQPRRRRRFRGSPRLSARLRPR